MFRQKCSLIEVLGGCGCSGALFLVSYVSESRGRALEAREGLLVLPGTVC